MVGDNMWAFVVMGGFVILGAAIAYAALRNRTTPAEDARTARATKQMYKEQSAEDRENE